MAAIEKEMRCLMRSMPPWRCAHHAHDVDEVAHLLIRRCAVLRSICADAQAIF
jgi:hypothetical protein